jgi:polyhydroxybutyrate depolymerase
LELQFRTIDIDGIERTYWVPSDQPRAPAPLLIAFHGLGMTGRKLALWTGLAERGPAAGFATAFPDALGRVWDDHGTVRRDGGDDIAFVDTLITRLRNTGAAGGRPVFLVGLSNGAAFAERVARTAAVDLAGVALVAGTAREASRTRTPAPLRPVALVAILGTADKSFPFEGGRSRSKFRRQASLRVRLALADTSGHEVVAAQTLLDDWTQVNGVAGESAASRLDPGPGDPSVTRLTWAEATPPSNATARPVVLYRVEGGGHGWPGARQVLTAKLFGRIPKRFDATGTVLEFARVALDLDGDVLTRSGR